MALSHTNDFFITLPCNSSLKYFPDNGPAEFKTKLAQPINLRGHWEVALAELQYCSSWNNVLEDMEFYYGTENDRRKLTIHKGHYDDLKDVLEVIEGKIVHEMKGLITFKYSHYMGKVLVNLAAGMQIWWLDMRLCRLLGMKSADMRDEGVHKGYSCVPYRIANPNMFVYTDVAVPVMVGDSHVPLLRIVSPSGQHGARLTVTYDRMHYVPVRSVNFDTIEVNISDDSGNLIQFNFGKTVVKLHFRPRKLSYL